MPLPKFEVQANLNDIPGLLLAGELAEVPLADVRVLFTSNLPGDRWIRFNNKMYRPPRKVSGEVDDTGALRKDGGALKLLANDPDLSVTGIQWEVRILVPSAAGRDQAMQPWVIDARADGEVVDLAETAPVPQLPPIEVGQYIIEGTPL